MNIEDLTPFERWQLEKYGNIICTTEPGPNEKFEEFDMEGPEETDFVTPIQD